MAEIINLKAVCDFLKNPDAPVTGRFVNIYGVFIREVVNKMCPNDRCWVLQDESLQDPSKEKSDGILIKMCATGDLPLVRPGDIVRIHRLRIKYGLKHAECSHSRNVAIWEAFLPQGQPVRDPRTTAECCSPEQDLKRIFELENWFSQSIQSLSQIKRDQQSFVSLCGLVIGTKSEISYGHQLIQIVDGSIPSQRLISEYSIDVTTPVPPIVIENSVTIRVYKKQKEDDINDHLFVAQKLQVHDLVFISNLSCTFTPASRVKFELRSNTKNGTCLRAISKDSLLGTIIKERIYQLSDKLSNETLNSSTSTIRRSQRISQRHNKDTTNTTTARPTSEDSKNQDLSIFRDTMDTVVMSSTPRTSSKSPSSSVSDEWLDVVQISKLINSPQSDRFCNFFGILKYIQYRNGEQHWIVTDDFAKDQFELDIKMSGSNVPYVPARPADIIRIHRLRLKYNKCECTHPADVVVWDAFLPHNESSPRGSVSKISVTDFDLHRKLQLENFFSCTSIADIDFRSEYINVSGQVLSCCEGDYGSYVIEIIDGSRRLTPIRCVYAHYIADAQDNLSSIFIRIYRNTKIDDTDQHIRVARELKTGDLIYISNLRVRIINGQFEFDLQSNTSHGKCLRKIHSGSIFGLKLLCSVFDVSTNCNENSMNFSDDLLEDDFPRESKSENFENFLRQRHSLRSESQSQAQAAAYTTAQVAISGEQNGTLEQPNGCLEQLSKMDSSESNNSQDALAQTNNEEIHDLNQSQRRKRSRRKKIKKATKKK